MSETLATCLTLLVIWQAYRCRDRRTPLSLAGVAALVGLAGLTRPELLLLFPFVVVPLALSSGAWRVRAGRLALACAATFATLLPWMAFNAVRFDEPVLMSTQLEVTMAAANCDSTYDGALKGYWDFRCAQSVLGTSDPPAFHEPAARRQLLDEALTYIGDNKGALPSVVAARLGRITGIGYGENQAQIDWFIEGVPHSVARWGVWSFYGMAVLAVIGAVVLRKQRIALYPILAPVWVVLVTVVTLYATTRFRAPADASLCLLAAAALARATRFKLKRA